MKLARKAPHSDRRAATHLPLLCTRFAAGLLACFGRSPRGLVAAHPNTAAAAADHGWVGACTGRGQQRIASIKPCARQAYSPPQCAATGCSSDTANSGRSTRCGWLACGARATPHARSLVQPQAVCRERVQGMRLGVAADGLPAPEHAVICSTSPGACASRARPAAAPTCSHLLGQGRWSWGTRAPRRPTPHRGRRHLWGGGVDEQVG